MRFDDPDLSDDELLYRRVWNKPDFAKVLEDGTVIPTSAVFLDNHTNEVSVSVSSMTTREEVLEGFPDFGLLSIEVRVPRTLDHIVAKTPEVLDPAHRVICPPSGHTKGQRKTAARTMSQQATWIVMPITKKGDSAG